MKLFSAEEISRAQYWKMLVYAKPGTGKTSLVRYLKGKTLVFDLDNSSRVLAGDKHVDVVQLDRNKPYEDMNTFMKEIEGLINNNGYQNLVIDNISSFEKDWFTERARNSKSHLNNQLQDYSAWTNYFNRLTGKLLSLRNVNVLMTAWEDTQDIQSPTGQSYTQYVPQIRKQVRDSLLGLTDLVGRLIISQRQENEGERFLIMRGDDTIFAKNRLDDRVYSSAKDLFTFADKDTQQPPKTPNKDKNTTKNENVTDNEKKTVKEGK